MTEELFSADSEIAVLSILLRNPEKLYETTSLREEYFSAPSHRILYRTIMDMVQAGSSPEKALILQRLNRSGDLNLVGEEFINKLYSSDYSPINYREFEKNVIDAFIAKNLISLGNKIPDMIKGTKDIQSVSNTILEGISSLTQYGDNSSTFPISGLVDEHWKVIKNRVENPGGNFISTGFQDIDILTDGGVEPGNLWIIASRPSMGKTSWLINSMLNASKSKGIKSLIFSREMSWLPLLDRILSIESKVNLHKIRSGAIADPEIEKVMEASRAIKNYPMYIDQKFVGNIDYITSTIRKFYHKHGISTVYLDYVQLIADRNEGSTHELGRISKALKILAEDLGIGIYLASQLNREVEFRDNKRPILSDLRQSGNLEEDADVVAFLYRDDYYDRGSDSKGDLEFIVRKNRNGSLGTVTMKFDENTTTIS